MMQCLSYNTADPCAHKFIHMISHSRLSIVVELVLKSLHMTDKAVDARSLQACRQDRKHAASVKNEPPCQVDSADTICSLQATVIVS